MSKPAFPTDDYFDERRNGQIPGMSMREYYAAHAPTDIPEWFDWVEPPEPEEPDLSALPLSAIEQLNEWRNKIGKCIGRYTREAIIETPIKDKTLHPFQEQFRTYWKACRKHHQECQAGRYFTWRWHYADTMLEIGMTPNA